VPALEVLPLLRDFFMDVVYVALLVCLERE